MVDADPSWVELVIIDGDLAYGRASWLGAPGDLLDASERERLEPLLAWGKPMVLDTTYRVDATWGDEPPRLAALRAELVAEYPPVGAIFA